MRTIIFVTLFIFLVQSGAAAGRYQVQLDFGYRPQVKTSDIDYPFLSSWEGFVDLPWAGAKILRPFSDEWFLGIYYRYLFKTSGLPANNEVTLNQHTVTIGPYYRSPTTDDRSFFINLSLGLGVSTVSFKPNIAGAADKLTGTDLAFIGTLGFERRLIGGLSLIGELNYSLLDCDVEGTFGSGSDIKNQITIKLSGLDLNAGLGYEFEI